MLGTETESPEHTEAEAVAPQAHAGCADAAWDDPDAAADDDDDDDDDADDDDADDADDAQHCQQQPVQQTVEKTGLQDDVSVRAELSSRAERRWLLRRSRRHREGFGNPFVIDASMV